MTTSPHHVLVVDDSPEDMDITRRFLCENTNGQFIINHVQSGEEGLEWAMTNRPDCILLDYNLPDMTGIEFLESLPFLEGKPLMPVVMLTSQGSEALAVQAIKNGAEDFLVKGQLTSSSLQVTVMGALTSATLHRSMREHRAHLKISQTLSTTDTLERATPDFLQEIGSTMNWQICILWAENEHTHTLSCLGIWSSPTLDCPEFIQATLASHLSPGEDLSGKAWTNGPLVHHTGNDEMQQCPRFSHMTNVPIAGAFAISFQSPHHFPVILECWYAHPRDVSPERFAMLKAIGRQVTQFLNISHIARNLHRRESEYQLVTNHVPALLASFDSEGRCRMANQHFQDCFGLNEIDMLNKDYAEILGTALHTELQPFVEQSFAGERVTCELLIPSSKDETRWVQATLIPDDIHTHGKASGFYFFASDITERKHNEEHLRQQAQELARSNAELEEFAHIASHDLQEPLRKVQTFSDRLRTRCASKLAPQELEYLERMHSATKRMQTLIRDLLTFSRVGKKGMPPQPVPLSPLIQEVLGDLETLINTTKASIHCQNLPIVEADPTHMRQLFQNLIGNALKFHQPDVPPIIHIEAYLDAQPMALTPIPSWVITVRDNGIGFEQQYADRIFGVFQRLHGRDQYEGTGIGLSICKKVIERYGGHITVESSPGTGTTFTLVFPTRKSQHRIHPGGPTQEATPRTPTSKPNMEDVPHLTLPAGIS